MTTYSHFERLAHLEEVSLAGGEQAIRQPRRVAAAYLYLAYGEAIGQEGGTGDRAPSQPVVDSYGDLWNQLSATARDQVGARS